MNCIGTQFVVFWCRDVVETLTSNIDVIVQAEISFDNANGLLKFFAEFDLFGVHLTPFFALLPDMKSKMSLSEEITGISLTVNTKFL